MPIYFAYGSNMDWTQMRNRCSSARFICLALLKDHCLAFTRRSVSRDCGVADVLPARGQNVWGIVYQISKEDLSQGLDPTEGFRPNRSPDKNAYNRRQGAVYQDGVGTKSLTAEIYFAVNQDNPPLPNQEYKNLLLHGARHWNLPFGYIAELEQIQVAS
jgi:hypothetical protein